jgi:hypothetical protein
VSLRRPASRLCQRRSEGRARVLPNPERMYTLGLDTIAGAKLLQLKFGSAAAFQPDQAVMLGDHRARFIRVSGGAAVIRRWGDSHDITVPLESLSQPPETQPQPRGTPRTQRRLLTTRPLLHRSSQGVADSSLSRTARRRVTII